MPTGKETLIVALDVPTVDEALNAVEELGDLVSFYKIGLQLFLTGELPRLLDALKHKQVFVDLKVPGDISNTIAAVIDLCVAKQVRFLTLSESMPPAAIGAAKAARDKHVSENPKLLTVPFLSSLGADDLKAMTGQEDVQSVMVQRARRALAAGCDGIIASGPEIRACREAFPDAVIVSPGIRPSGATTDDHKRSATPREAILMGSDYLVVGRPIMKSHDRRSIAQAILREMDQAFAEKMSSRA